MKLAGIRRFSDAWNLDKSMWGWMMFREQWPSVKQWDRLIRPRRIWGSVFGDWKKFFIYIWFVTKR